MFGPNENDNYIQNVGSGNKIYMRKQRGSFVVDGQFGDGQWKQITVDSAAEEAVCPKGQSIEIKLRELGCSK